MAETPDWADWRQLLETGRQFTAMTRAEAQQRAHELVREGQLAQDKVQAFVDGLVRTSRKRADELVEVVRKEVQRQLEALGIKERGARAKAGAKKAAKKKAAKKTAKPKAPAKKKAAKTAKPKTSAKKKAVKKTARKTAKAGARKPSGSS
ncbi:MAG TPA: hypothetical protein VF152_09865 [Acidimicrobiia bacterium]